MNWHSPITFSQWARRWTSISNLGLICTTALILWIVIHNHWPEYIVGAYLASTNASRDEKGAIWEAGQGVTAAKAHIAGIIRHREKLRLNVLRADSFAELAASLAPEQWVKVEKETLIRLYQTLPDKTSRLLMDPLRLVWLIKAEGASQILCQGKAQGMAIYFMDANRQIIGIMDFPPALLGQMQRSKLTAKISLEQLPEFADHIYPAPIFFRSALRLPKDMLENLMKNPDILMSQPGTLHRVGIANQSEAGYVRIGFEFLHEKAFLVIQTRAKEWAVWQLGLFLQEDAQ